MAGRGTLISLILSLGLILATDARCDDVVITVPRYHGYVTKLSQQALTAIFGMRLTVWPDGTPIRVFVFPDDAPVHAQCCKQVLHVFPHQMRAAWDRLVFSGTGQAPEIVTSPHEMKSRLEQTPGAIGYLTKEFIDDSVSILSLY